MPTVIVSEQTIAAAAAVDGEADGKLAYAVVLLLPVVPLATLHVPDVVSLSKPIQYDVPLVTLTGVPKVSALEPVAGLTMTVAEPSTAPGTPLASAKIVVLRLPV